jgi:alpha-tubulin suppressor-like RCC1 family protein
MSETGEATFPSLEAGTPYFLGAEVAGVWVWVTARTPVPEGVDLTANVANLEGRIAGDETSIGTFLRDQAEHAEQIRTIEAQITEILRRLNEKTEEPVKTPDVTRAAAFGDNSYAEAGLGWVSGGDLTSLVGSLIQNAATIQTGNSSVIALMQDGTLRGNGTNGFGQLGTGDLGARRTPARIVPSITNAEWLQVGAGSSMVGLRDKTIRVWGSSLYGKNGDGQGTEAALELVPSEQPHASMVEPFIPQVRNEGDTGGSIPALRPNAFAPIPEKVKAGGVGVKHSVALGEAGYVWGWGLNLQGQLGLGHTKGSRGGLNAKGEPIGGFQGSAGSPITYTNTRPEKGQGLTNPFQYKEEGNGKYQVFKRVGKNLMTGQIEYGWVEHTEGGSEQQFPVKMKETALYEPKSGEAAKKAIAAACGEQHTVVLLGDLRGTCVACGANTNGQLGDGTTTGKTELTEVKGLPTKAEVEANAGKKVVAVTCSAAGTLFMLKNGEVRGCGNNGMGQLGLGSTQKTFTEATPVPFFATHAATFIVGGGQVNYAITTGGKLQAFGNNSAGQLCNGQKLQAASLTAGTTTGVEREGEEYGLLAAELKQNTAHVSISTTSLTASVPPKQKLVLEASPGNTQTVEATAEALQGASSVTTKSFTAALTFPVGSKVLGTSKQKWMEGGNRIVYEATGSEEAQTVGQDGNNIAVEIVKAPNANEALKVETREESGKRIVKVTLGTNSANEAASEATSVVAAINQHATAGTWLSVYVANPGNVKSITHGTGIVATMALTALSGGEGGPARTPAEIALPQGSECIGVSGNQQNSVAMWRGTAEAIKPASINVVNGTTVEIFGENPSEPRSKGWKIIYNRLLSSGEKSKLQKEQLEGKFNEAERKSKEKELESKYGEGKKILTTNAGQLPELLEGLFTTISTLEAETPQEPFYYEVILQNSEPTSTWEKKTFKFGGGLEVEAES